MVAMACIMEMAGCTRSTLGGCWLRSATVRGRGPDRFQQLEQHLELGFVQRRHDVLVHRVDLRVQRSEQLPTGVGRKAQYLPAIGIGALTPDDSCVLELVEQSSDCGSL